MKTPEQYVEEWDKHVLEIQQGNPEVQLDNNWWRTEFSLFIKRVCVQCYNTGHEDGQKDISK